MSKILVVDDEQDIVDLISLHMAREGHECIGIHSGLEVMPAALREEPDLIVLDLMLPGQDGLQVFKSLRAESRTRGIPVIMLTANALDEHMRASQHAGADLHLSKPIRAASLIEAIVAAVEGRGEGDEARPVAEVG